LTVEALEDRTVPSVITPAGHPEVVSSNPNDWPMYNHDVAGTRYNSAEDQLGPQNVSGLKVQWTFPTKAVVAGTPAVVGNHIYAADASGTVYALTSNGHLLWSNQVAGPVTASLLVTNRSVIFGDLGGFLYDLDVNTGALRWKIRPNSHPFASIFGSPTMVGNYVAIGVASIEEPVAAKIPGYQPSFRGSLVLLDPETGRVVWQTYTVTEQEHAAGAAGAGIWSTPTYDPESHTIYASTGNQYSPPNIAMSDSIIAFDASTGRVKWVNQFNKTDTWNFTFPPTSQDAADFDFGDSPQIYRVDGRKVVGAGQKSGFYHVVGAASGADINPGLIQVQQGGQLSGLFADSAVAHGVVFANTSYWKNGFVGGSPQSGSLVAISGDGTKELWNFPTNQPDLSGVAVANGVVYFQSIDGNFFALNARTGRLLAEVHTGGQSSGSSVSHGHVYLGLGDAFALVADLQHPPPGAIIALGVDERDDREGQDHLTAGLASDGLEQFGRNAPTQHGLLSIAAELAQDVPAINARRASVIWDGSVVLTPATVGEGAPASLLRSAGSPELSYDVSATRHGLLDTESAWLTVFERQDSLLTDWALVGP
jgi:polyvinyl alcohol dehydrogenase (cytochrome)